MGRDPRKRGSMRRERAREQEKSDNESARGTKCQLLGHSSAEADRRFTYEIPGSM